MSSTTTASTAPMTSLMEANKAHFNGMAADNVDKRPDIVEMNRRVAVQVQKMYKFDPKTTDVLEFACGTGLLSRNLAPYCKSILGVDISQGMVDVYNEEADNEGIDPFKMYAIVKALTGAPDELGGRKFDVIVCSMAYHHLESISTTTRALLTHLRPSGTLLVIDIHKLPSTSPAATELKTLGSVNQDHVHGFTEEELRLLFVDEMGLGGFKREVFGHAYACADRTFVFPEGEGEEADRVAQREAERKGKLSGEGHGHEHGHGHGHGHKCAHGHGQGPVQTAGGAKVEFFIAMANKSA